MSIYNTAYNYVMSLYPSRVWRDRVSKMSDSQIIAIYFREIKKPKTEKKETYHQMTLDEWSEERRNQNEG